MTSVLATSMVRPSSLLKSFFIVGKELGQVSRLRHSVPLVSHIAGDRFSSWSTSCRTNSRLPARSNYYAHGRLDDLKDINSKQMCMGYPTCLSIVARFSSSTNDKKTDVKSDEQTKKVDQPDDVDTDDKPPEKLGLVARFKLMYKQYWYVLLPVHVVTSTGWLVGFYYLSRSGVDIPVLLQTIHISETLIDKLKDSSMGHVAIAYMCYKVMTPIRYTVTLGGTTLSINYLSRWGYIKPIPSKERLKQIFDDRKAMFTKSKDQESK